MLERLAPAEPGVDATFPASTHKASTCEKVALNRGTSDRARIRRILDEPGMDLAIELWAGPGAFDQLIKEYFE